MSEPLGAISIHAHLIVDNATLSLSGSTITLEFPSREDAEAVRDCLMGEDVVSLTAESIEDLKQRLGTKTSLETFRAVLAAAKSQAEKVLMSTSDLPHPEA